MTDPKEISLFDDQEFISDQNQFELKENVESIKLIKSKERVQNHGEVFTPKWMVQKMLAEPAIQAKLQDLHATFLEPSAGEGAFLVEILHQKLNYVDQTASKTNWPKQALWALMSIYGIELLQDNLIKARTAMMEVVINHYQAVMQKKLTSSTDFYKAVKFVIHTNIVQGNTLEYTNKEGQLIEFSHWWPVEGKVQREVFTYKSLFNNSDVDDVGAADGQLSLFDESLSEENNEYVLCEVTKVYEEERKNDEK
ncbi:methylase [Limosilactobacillus fermentum]|nr:methylase [Limosilactobacillus fermentum]QID94337.1 methylase [Limosilactobacillus fermentum]TFZ20115.1 methylase [Limosilactobacillus fermentum]